MGRQRELVLCVWGARRRRGIDSARRGDCYEPGAVFTFGNEGRAEATPARMGLWVGEIP